MYSNIFWIAFLLLSFSRRLESSQKNSLIKFELLNIDDEKDPNANQCELSPSLLPETYQSGMVKIDQLNYLLKLTIAEENLLNGTIRIISEKSQNENVQTQWTKIIVAINGKIIFLPANIKIVRQVTSADVIVNYHLDVNLVLKLPNGLDFELKYNLNLIIQENLFNLNFTHLNKLNCPWLKLNHSLLTEPPSILEFQSSIENRCPNANDVRIFIQLASDFWPMANFVLNQQFNFDENGDEQMNAMHPLFDVVILGKWWPESKIDDQIFKYEKEMHLKIKPTNTYIHAHYSQLKKTSSNPLLLDLKYFDIDELSNEVNGTTYLPSVIVSLWPLLFATIIGVFVGYGLNLFISKLILSIFSFNMNVWFK